MSINVFKAAADGTKDTKKVIDNTQPVHLVKGKTFYNKAAEAHKLSVLLETTKKAYDALQAELKNEAMEAYVTMYTANGQNPNSIIVTTDEIGGKSYSYMYTPQDSYKKIDKAAYDNLVKIYGTDIADTETVYIINNPILIKHKDKIVKAIKEIKGMTDEDKAKLLTATPVYNVKKGTIDNIMAFCRGKNIRDKVSSLINAVSPTFLFKNLKETAPEPQTTVTLKKSTKK